MTTAKVKTIPLNNNVLIEVIREDADVSLADSEEDLKQGVVVDASLSPYHLTASAGLELDNFMYTNGVGVEERRLNVQGLIGKKVRWEQYAGEGQTFKENGKTYALVAWWRLISYEEAQQ